uniref:3-oxo-5alpha-steroid 4-dehydrogenase (NADP(+)) n=1 Tax=Setaria digitata TaxID=48799 RepID=A0A915PLU0_9BILA
MARGYTAKWAWFVQEIPSLYIPLYYLVTNITSLPFINAFVLVLFCLHYVNRALIYPLLIKSGTGTPVHVFLLAFLFCTVNGYMQGAWHSHYVIYNKSLKNITFCFIDVFNVLYLCCSATYILHIATGLVVYVIGMIINILSDSILRDLRKDGKPGYRIPYGGLFTYVSGANFFGECVEWIGYALLTRTLPACAFAFFTLCNLAPRAYHHHRWYLKKFDEYPKNRKAFIPFVI